MSSLNQPISLHSYYRQLQLRVTTWLESEEAKAHPCAELYPHLPELFLLLAQVGLDPRIEDRERGGILSALKYIVAPFDLIPEGILGPAGYCEDLVLAALVVERLSTRLDEELLRQYWHGREDIRAVARTILETATTMVGGDTCERLRDWLPTPESPPDGGS